MSDKTAPTVHNITDLNTEIVAEPEPTRRQKLVTFVKAHKKSTIAVGALAGLVVVGALTGNKSATVTVTSPLELEIEDVEQSEDQSA